MPELFARSGISIFSSQKGAAIVKAKMTTEEAAIAKITE
jgi:hypothetical protein